jgi:hypothetical protein
MDQEKHETQDLDIPDRASSELCTDHEQLYLGGWRLYFAMTG